MARKTGQSIPSYRKHRATGQAVCTIFGRDFYLGPHGTKASHLEYDRLVSEWLAAGRPTSSPSNVELSVSELIVRFWKHAQKRYVKNGKPTSELHLIQNALRPLRELYGSQPVSQFGPLALKAIRSKMIDKNWARKTINDSTKRIVRMFRWGVAEQIVEPHIVEALRAVEGLRKGGGEARETAPVEPVDDSIVEATLEHMPMIVADMVRLQRRTAARPSEICRLRPCDLDRSADEWIYRPDSHKTEHHGHERIVPIGPRGQQILMKYLVRATDTICFRRPSCCVTMKHSFCRRQ
jgi:integrase